MRYLKNNKIFYYKYVNKKNCINKKDTFDSRESNAIPKIGASEITSCKIKCFYHLNNIENITNNNSVLQCI